MMLFDIEHKGEPAAEIIGYSDRVEITIESCDPGGEPGEFEQHMKEALAEWFDGAEINIRR